MRTLLPINCSAELIFRCGFFPANNREALRLKSVLQLAGGETGKFSVHRELQIGFLDVDVNRMQKFRLRCQPVFAIAAIGLSIPFK